MPLASVTTLILNPFLFYNPFHFLILSFITLDDRDVGYIGDLDLEAQDRVATILNLDSSYFDLKFFDNRR